MTLYHQADHLVFQFILSKLIQAHEALSAYISNCKNKESLRRLTGHHQMPMKLIHWTDSNEGFVENLKNHCALFVLHFAAIPECPSNNMHEEARKAWILSLNLEIEAQSNEQNGQSEELTIQLGNAFKKIAFFASQLAQRFKDNENVLFFLVRKQQQLDAIIGQPYVKPLMEEMFTYGLVEAQEKIIEKYTSRGFSDLERIGS